MGDGVGRPFDHPQSERRVPAPAGGVGRRVGAYMPPDNQRYHQVQATSDRIRSYWAHLAQRRARATAPSSGSGSGARQTGTRRVSAPPALPSTRLSRTITPGANRISSPFAWTPSNGFSRLYFDAHRRQGEDRGARGRRSREPIGTVWPVAVPAPVRLHHEPADETEVDRPSPSLLLMASTVSFPLNREGLSSAGIGRVGSARSMPRNGKAEPDRADRSR